MVFGGKENIMHKLILTNGKYVRTKIEYGRTLPLEMLEAPKEIKMVSGPAFHHVTVERQFNCRIFTLGSYVYYFNLVGELTMMMRKTPHGTLRLNENFAENNEILEIFMKVMTTWKMEK